MKIATAGKRTIPRFSKRFFLEMDDDSLFWKFLGKGEIEFSEETSEGIKSVLNWYTIRGYFRKGTSI